MIDLSPDLAIAARDGFIAIPLPRARMWKIESKLWIWPGRHAAGNLCGVGATPHLLDVENREIIEAARESFWAARSAPERASAVAVDPDLRVALLAPNSVMQTVDVVTVEQARAVVFHLKIGLLHPYHMATVTTTGLP